MTGATGRTTGCTTLPELICWDGAKVICGQSRAICPSCPHLKQAVDPNRQAPPCGLPHLLHTGAVPELEPLPIPRPDLTLFQNLLFVPFALSHLLLPEVPALGALEPEACAFDCF